MVAKIWINFGQDNGFKPDGTNPLPETMLSPQWGSLAFAWEQSHVSSFSPYHIRSMN